MFLLGTSSNQVLADSLCFYPSASSSGRAVHWRGEILEVKNQTLKIRIRPDGQSPVPQYIHISRVARIEIDERYNFGSSTTPFLADSRTPRLNRRSYVDVSFKPSFLSEDLADLKENHPEIRVYTNNNKVRIFGSLLSFTNNQFLFQNESNDERSSNISLFQDDVRKIVFQRCRL